MANNCPSPFFMPHPIKLSDGVYQCIECSGIYKSGEVSESRGLCKRCTNSIARTHAGQIRMSEQKALFDATRKLADQIAKQSRNTAVSPEFFDQLSKELGGARGLGERIAADFKRIHGEGLSAAEQALFSHDEKTIQRYWQMLLQFMQQQDRQNAVDISSLSDKELQATLMTLARELITDDREFRRQVIKAAVATDKGLIEELAIEAGLLGPSIDGKVAEEEDAAEYIEPEEG